MSDHDPALDGFAPLIGTWKVEARHRLLDDVATGEVSFDWLPGGHFVVQRSRNDHPRLPDRLSVIGPPEDGDGLVLEYFDSRGVRRTYRTSLQDGVWRTWRDAPGFDQRSSARIAPDAFECLYELAEAPGEWVQDLRVIYRRG